MGGDRPYGVIIARRACSTGLRSAEKVAAGEVAQKKGAISVPVDMRPRTNTLRIRGPIPQHPCGWRVLTE